MYDMYCCIVFVGSTETGSPSSSSKNLLTSYNNTVVLVLRSIYILYVQIYLLALPLIRGKSLLQVSLHTVNGVRCSRSTDQHIRSSWIRERNLCFKFQQSTEVRYCTYSLCDTPPVVDYHLLSSLLMVGFVVVETGSTIGEPRRSRSGRQKYRQGSSLRTATRNQKQLTRAARRCRNKKSTLTVSHRYFLRTFLAKKTRIC